MKSLLSCPHCGNLSQIELIKAGGRARGYAQARAKILERMKTYCTPEAHKERAKEKAYCNLCHRRIIAK